MLAASLVLGCVWLLLGGRVQPGGGGHQGNDLHASLTLDFGNRGDNKLSALKIQSDFKGFATLVVLSPKSPPEVIPAAEGDDPIRLAAGAVESVQWPDNLQVKLPE